MGMFESAKGKDWHDQPLIEDNLKAGELVCWRGKVYRTGNRYHNLVELYRGRKLICAAKISSIRLVRDTQFSKAQRIFKMLTAEQRLDIINRYCKHCGGDDPSCACMRAV